MQGAAKRCKASRAGGQPCSNGIVLASGYCVMHDPARQAQLASIRSAGGKAKSNANRAAKMLPSQLRPVLDKLIAALDSVQDETLTPQQASAMAAVARAIVTVMTAGQVEERLRELEQRCGVRSA